MLKIEGNLQDLYLEENLNRFVQIVDWAQNHKCVLQNNCVIIKVNVDGMLVEINDETGLRVELGDLYEYYAVCKSCGKKARSNFEG